MSMRAHMNAALTAAAITVTAMVGMDALAAGGADTHVEDFQFSFEGPFGTYDQNQLQRGLKVYTEVCAACHGLQHVPIRSLAEPGGPGFSAAEVTAYAAENFEIFDADLDDFRPARPVDNFPVNESVDAPDLSLMAKARAGFTGPYGTGLNQLFKGMGGPEYIASLLTSYTGKEKEEAGAVLYENTAFPGGWISMAPPLVDGQVTFDDGHADDLRHASEDVAAFLMWAAEPKLAARKQAGLSGVILLIVLACLLYLVNKRLWHPIKREKEHA